MGGGFHERGSARDAGSVGIRPGSQQQADAFDLAVERSGDERGPEFTRRRGVRRHVRGQKRFDDVLVAHGCRLAQHLAGIGRHAGSLNKRCQRFAVSAFQCPVQRGFTLLVLGFRVRARLQQGLNQLWLGLPCGQHQRSSSALIRRVDVRPRSQQQADKGRCLLRVILAHCRHQRGTALAGCIDISACLEEQPGVFHIARHHGQSERGCTRFPYQIGVCACI